MKVDEFVAKYDSGMLCPWTPQMRTAIDIIERQREALDRIEGMATIETVDIQKVAKEALDMEV